MVLESLGYLVVESTDLAAWRRFGTEVLGCAVAAESDDERLWLRLDDRAARIIVERGKRDHVIAAGWEVRDDIEFEAVLARFDSAGIRYQHESDLAPGRGVTDLVSLTDPSGHRVEICWGPTVASTPFMSPAGVSGFVTGDQGLGHVVITCPNFDESDRFYRRVLGFGLSDFADMGGMRGHFLHINERHHSLALIEAPHDAWFARGGLIHLMIEARTLPDVGRALGRAEAAGCQLFETLGQHENDKMTSFYVFSPAGFPIEFGTGGISVVKGRHVAQNIPFPDIWGHAVLGMPQ